ncbi:hypothetical protein M9Y10_010302 [Tritrichomonas musculus]|uniref:Uncharacterized protein n=1 Tax=Tritrichomonas musculus TaxID=1915356 RepID=A0ABR2IKH9_9EUKA
MKGGKTRDYLEAIPRGLYPLQATNVSVGSVVIDGNAAQKKLGTQIIRNQFII